MKKIATLALGIMMFFACSNEYGGNYASYEDYYMPLQGDKFTDYGELPFYYTSEADTATFSIDVDGASYRIFYNAVNDGYIPEKASVRIEEWINYFYYDLPEPKAEEPVSVTTDMAVCPWNTNNRVISIGMKGKDIPRSQLPAANFVLLIDVSGSMNHDSKLGLLKEAMKLFVDAQRDDDRIAIVTYSGNVKKLLDSTPCSEKTKIKRAINKLDAGGSTAGGAAMEMAYEIARDNFIDGGNNRIIMGTDGDFNVGLSGDDNLVEFIEEKRETGVYLTVLGFGSGNLNDSMMEKISNAGNGNYEYIDNLDQAKKVMVADYNSFFTIAQDVKVQLVFNENVVEQYRLIGYANRVLDNDDFTNDSKDAGDISSNQSIMAMYELVMAENASDNATVCSIDFRYKTPGEDQSRALEQRSIYTSNTPIENAGANLRWAACVAELAMLVIDSEYKGSTSFNHVRALSEKSANYDPENLRRDFIEMIDNVELLHNHTEQ